MNKLMVALKTLKPLIKTNDNLRNRHVVRNRTTMETLFRRESLLHYSVEPVG